MSTAVAGAVIATLLLAPHALPQQRLAATSAIALWTGALLLRATLAVSLVVVAVLYLPATELFSLMTHWCLHAVIPFVATHLGFDGHSLGDAAILVPALVVAASFVSVAFGAWRGARAARRWLNTSSLGPGPGASVIVGGSEVVVAAAGLRAPRVVVSAGALVHLDDAELAAGLEHEWGHVRRRHRYVSLFAEILLALSRPLPGGRRAMTSLQFHLERDADDYAVRRTGDPLALASAICKAAATIAPSAATPAFASLAGSGVPERLRGLCCGDGGPTSRLDSSVARTLAALSLAATLAVIVAAPALAATGLEMQRASAEHSEDCA